MNKKLFITPEFTLGGAEAQLRLVISEFEDRGEPVDVLVLHTRKKGIDENLKKAKREYKYVSFIEFNLYHKSEYKFCREIEKFILNSPEGEYDSILIVHEWFTPLIPLLQEKGIACVYSELSDAEMVCKNRRYHNGIQSCDLLSANSGYAARKIEKEFQRPVRVIRNGKERVKRLPYTFLREGVKHILVPCRITPVKNLMVVLDLLRDYPEREFMVRFAGEKEFSSYLGSLERRIIHDRTLDQVEFLGYCPDIREQYAWSDVVLLPSLVEGTPNVILEAYAYGRPVIVSDIEAERELVPDPGLRFSPKDPEKLYDCISYLENMDGSVFRKMLDENAEYVLQNYNIDKMTDAFISAMKEAREGRVSLTPTEELRTSNLTNSVQSVQPLHKLRGEVNEPSECITCEENEIVQQGAGWHDEVYRACSIERDAILEEFEKKEMFYLLLCEWNRQMQEGHSLSEKLVEMGFYRIAIYGFKELGELLLRDLLRNKLVSVNCVIDKDALRFDLGDVRIVTPDEARYDEFDLVVVTAVSHFDEIRNSINDRTDCTDCTVISLGDLLGFSI